MSNTTEKTEPVAPKLTNVLRGIGEREFWIDRDKTHPAYSLIFAAVATVLFEGHLKTGQTLLQEIAKGERLNLSSFQRAVAKEAEARKGAKPAAANKKGKPAKSKAALLGATSKKGKNKKSKKSKLLA